MNDTSANSLDKPPALICFDYDYKSITRGEDVWADARTDNFYVLPVVQCERRTLNTTIHLLSDPPRISSFFFHSFLSFSFRQWFQTLTLKLADEWRLMQICFLGSRGDPRVSQWRSEFILSKMYRTQTYKNISLEFNRDTDVTGASFFRPNVNNDLGFWQAPLFRIFYFVCGK